MQKIFISTWLLCAAQALSMNPSDQHKPKKMGMHVQQQLDDLHQQLQSVSKTLTQSYAFQAEWHLKKEQNERLLQSCNHHLLNAQLLLQAQQVYDNPQFSKFVYRFS